MNRSTISAGDVVDPFGVVERDDLIADRLEVVRRHGRAIGTQPNSFRRNTIHSNQAASRSALDTQKALAFFS
jgi:hypothetical protein